MKIDKSDIINLLLVILAFVLVTVFYDKMPDPTPTHWNLKGEADDFTPKPWGPLVGPLTMLGIMIMFIIIPYISPKNYRIEHFGRTYSLIKVLIVAFLFIINVIAVFKSIGMNVRIDMAVTMAVGLLFMILGNYMGKLTKNFFVGIRTPWTLSSDEVWRRTHRFGGKVFVSGGFFVILLSIFKIHGILLFILLITIAVIPSLYSLVIYKRIEGLSQDETNFGKS